jgi:hypothetical protein
MFGDLNPHVVGAVISIAGFIAVIVLLNFIDKD